MGDRRCTKTLALGFALSAVLAIGRHDARADANNDAQKLFDEAMALINDHAYDKACPKLEEVVRLRPGKVGAMIELARCYESWGKTASAWKSYSNIARTAPPDDKRGPESKAKADELSKHLATLTLSVAPADRAMSGFSLSRDGVSIATADWDAPVPIDPGEYVIAANAPGHNGWSSKVVVAPGGPTKMSIPSLDDPSAASSSGHTVTGQPGGPSGSSGSSRPLWPVAIGYTLTAGALGAGIGTLVAANAPPNVKCATKAGCPAGDSYESKHNALSNASLWSFVGAGVLAAGTTGYLIWAVTGKKTTEPQKALVVPMFGPGFQGGVVDVSF